MQASESEGCWNCNIPMVAELSTPFCSCCCCLCLLYICPLLRAVSAAQCASLAVLDICIVGPTRLGVACVLSAGCALLHYARSPCDTSCTQYWGYITSAVALAVWGSASGSRPLLPGRHNHTAHTQGGRADDNQHAILHPVICTTLRVADPAGQMAI